MSENVVVVTHPLVQHKLTLLRDKHLSTGQFRQLLGEIGPLMLYEATRDLPLELRQVETPIAVTQSPVLAGKKLCFVPIMRAGLGLVDAMLDLVPSARVGHIGLYRDPATLEAVEYYLKLPDDIARRLAIVVDPMLATGHSATAAVHRLKELGAGAIKFVCLVAAPAGLALMQAEHPDVPIFTAVIDEGLDDHAYIVPGLGDAGDRLFGTK
ncbi:MAG TPA: uracil phosphoribosyltransferase [Stellaceae bacterium]|nr:uracil phosphoribosyltransferase [Stellaceae bacterium]